MRMTDKTWHRHVGRKASVRRNLTPVDRNGWADAQDSRAMDKGPKDQESIRNLIRNRNPVRWWQLQRDFKWVQKEMKRLGLNPEDARFLL